MAVIGPREYAAKYWEMEIPIFDNDNEIVAWEQIEFKTYRRHQGWRKSPVEFPPGQTDFVRAVDKYAINFFQQNRPIILQVTTIWGTDVELVISSMSVWNKVLVQATAAFSGKGSPEDIQLTLQLAARCGVAPNGLQLYIKERVDDYARLGLDGNGFVDNYLRYRNSANPWSLNPAQFKITDSSTITAIIKALDTNSVTNIEDLMIDLGYIMDLVEGNCQIIEQYDRDGGVPHVVSTEATSLDSREVCPADPQCLFNSLR